MRSVEESESPEDGQSGSGAVGHFFKKSPKLNSQKQSEITNSLVKFVASAYLPLSAVENPTFKEFIKQLNPGYVFSGDLVCKR